MKRMLYVIIMILSVNVHAQTLIPEFFSSADKQLHMAGCFMISSVTTSLVYNRTADKRKAILVGFAAGMVAGIAKEISDIEHGSPQWGDVAADAIGSGLGAVSITFTF